LDGPQPSPSPPSIHGAEQPRYGAVHIRNRGRLPHWEKEAGLYFITFHLADSLPKAVLEKVTERHRILSAAKEQGATLLPEQKNLIAAYSQKRIEEFHDNGHGSCALADPRVAAAMASALQFWHGKRYRLLAWCIMPNHIHVVVRFFPGYQLGAVVKSWKQYSTKATKHALGLTGKLWQREYYDRLIRNGEELDRAIRYVLKNPEKAGLKDWPWVWSGGIETGRADSAVRP
jgi:REP element-mobilizing transposase RayT